VGISNFTCTNFEISSIASSLPTPTSLSLTLEGVHVDCAGHWNVSWTILSGEGDIKANATVRSFKGVLDLVKDNVTGLENHSQVRRGRERRERG
jgi:hypothetical protein